jgi:hypothetical protein
VSPAPARPQAPIEDRQPLAVLGSQAPSEAKPAGPQGHPSESRCALPPDYDMLCASTRAVISQSAQHHNTGSLTELELLLRDG